MERINYPGPKQNYKVLTICYTYNHSKYIEDTLNGFAMQVTGFPFVCLVIDDASTDGEPEVIRRWLNQECDMENADLIDIPTSEVIIVPHKTNMTCTFAVYLLKRNLWKQPEEKRRHIEPWRERCEYAALCEGDDYWIDSGKLQLQVNFLDSHKDFSMCFHNVNVISFCNKDITLYSHLENREYNGGEIYKKWTVPTCSVLYRMECHYKVPKDTRFNVGDNVLFLTCASVGFIFCINKRMGVYRRVESGWTANNIGVEAIKKSLEHQNALLEHFPQYKSAISYVRNRCYLRLARKLYRTNPFYSIECIFKSFMKNPIISIRQIIEYLLAELESKSTAKCNKLNDRGCMAE